MWLSLQTSSSGLDLSTIVYSLAGVVSLISLKLVSVWQSRVQAAEAKTKAAEDEEKKATERLAALRDAEVEFWRSHAMELQASKTKNLETILAAIQNIRPKGATEPPRNDSPPPGQLQRPRGDYSLTSMTNPTKTRK